MIINLPTARDTHGLGVRVDEAKLKKYRVEDASPGGS